MSGRPLSSFVKWNIDLDAGACVGVQVDALHCPFPAKIRVDHTGRLWNLPHHHRGMPWNVTHLFSDTYDGCI